MNHRTRRARKLVVLLAVTGAALMLVAAACGSSSGKAKSGDTTASTAAAGDTTGSSATSSSAAGAANASAVYKIKADKKLGPILADAKGLTLYTLTSNGKAVACSAACLKFWPAATVAAGTSASGTAGVNGLGTVAGPGGTKMLAYQGLPLYTYVQDKDQGDAYGDGIASFGGVWHVVTPGMSAGTGASTGASTGATTPTTTATTSSGGYGY